MGCKFNQNNKEEKIIGNNNKYGKAYKFEIEDISLTNQTKENTDNSSITMNSESYENQKKYIYYNFLWKGKGKNVQLSGDFSDNWKTKVNMEKNPKTGFFEVKLPLERKKYNFKFIIDGDWVCSDLYQINYDAHYNLNNTIDLTNFYNNEITKEKNNNNEIEIINNKYWEYNFDNIVSSKNEDIKKKYFNSKYPLINELNTIAPIVMEHYKFIFNIDSQSKQDFLKIKFSKKYKSFKENNFNNENSTYKKIMIWPHIKLLHFCYNLCDESDINKNFLRTCITNRNQNKFLTIVYYKPK